MVGRSGIAVALALAAVSALSGHASAQSPDSGIAAEPVVPSADEVAAAKFDPGFYDKVRAITDAQAQGGTGDARYYDVLIIVSRDNGDGVDPDQTAARNKRAVAEELESMGARDIIQGGSLSFVAASVPVHMIEQVSMMGEVYKLGDGEAEIELALDTSKATTSSTSKSIDAVPGAAGLNGSGVVVSAIERSMYNPHVFDGQVIEHIGCNIGIEYRCNVSAGNIHVRSGFGGEHGVQVAQIIGASGLPEGNGVAPGVKFINVNVNLRHYLNVAIILDMLVQRGVDLVNMSFSSTKPISACDPYYSPTYSLLANEAVDRGVVVVVSAGNGGSSLGFAEYGTVFAPGCAHNVITVGGISDRGSDITVYESTSRGPTADGRLKPEIVAPAHNLRLLVGSESTKMADRISGTSFAAPQVVGAAALLLQANPDLTPAEVKAALLLGAAWTGPSGCTSLKYEAEDPSSGCSHARQVRDLNRASSAHEGLQMLNNVGLGILNTSDAVRYVLDPAHVRPGYLGSSADESRYHFTVTDTNKQAKIILTWMAHPHGGIDDRVPTFLPKAPFPGSNGIINSNPTNVADLDFVTLDPDGRPVAAASGVSAWQNVEFAVFEPARAGTYTIIVNGTHIEDTNKLGQRFALASTHQLDSMRPSNEPPVAGDIDVVVQQGVPRKILLTGDDEDGDPVSFRISKEPENGLVSKADPVGRSSAYVLYEASGPGADSFEVTPYDEFGDGAPATITLVPESLPPNARSSDGAMRIITDTDVLSTRAESARGGYSETFPGKAYPVSRLQLASSHLIEPVANVSIGSDTYTIAIPDDGFRRVTFGSPVVIDSVTLYAKGVDVGFSQKKKANPLAEGSAQAHVGYKSVPTKDEATPDIYLLGPNPHYVKAGGPRSFYHSVDPGAICLDDADPDRTVKQSRDIPLSKAGSFKVTYRCTDDRNNSNETTRRVIVDDKPPRKPVGINVKKNLSLDLGDPFTPSQTARCRQDSGTRVALDVYVIGIDGRTKIDALDTSKSGRYKVVYECRDRAGHASSIEQVVVVGLDMGPPRFMHFLKSSTPNYCTVDLARGLGPISSIDGSIWYTPDGLVARVPFYNNSDYPHPASVEINSLDTDKTIVVYNFERTRVTDDIYMATVTVPPEALSVISGDIENDGFNANVVYSKRSIRPSNFAIPADKTFATSITHPGVDIEEFETFRHKSLYTHLTPNGVDKIVKFENGVLTEVPYILHGVSSSDKCYYPYGETLNLNDLGTPGIAEMPSLVHLQPGSGEHRSACTGSVPKVVRNDTFRSTNEEVYTIRYTCTNGLRDSEPIDVTYVIDGTLPVVSVTQPDPHYVQPVLGGRYMDVDPMATCTDVSPGSVRSVTSDADHASISSDSSFTVTYTCADMAGNFRTAERLVVVDGTDPGEPAGVAPVSLEAGQPFNRGPITCPKDSGSPVDLVNTTTVRNTGEVIQIIDASIPGSYDIEYKCRDRAGNESKGRGQSVDITEVLEPGRGSDPEITGTEVIHFRQGTEPPAHGLTCADGAADLTSTITGDIAVDSTTPDGNATVTYTCTDELESKTVTHEVTYIVDGTPPVISPATGTIQLELGGTFTPETVTCTDPYPKASISNIDRAGRPAVEAALLSKAESSPQVTYDCKDAVDNHAVQSVRTFQILDTTPPAAPSVSAPAVDVPEGAVLDLGDVICAQDGGTPITLRNTTTLDNAPYTGPITTSTPGTYEITYACRDANQAGDPATQTVTVNPAPGRGSDPEITGTEVIHFRQGTEPPAHGLTCADGAADLTSTITGDIAVDSTTPDGNATVTYTCTDELESKTVTHEVTYIVDGTPPVISPATGTIQLELGGTFTPETVTCTDPYPKASISNIDRAGRPAVEAALLSKAESSPQVTYDCKDAVDNHAVQSVRTFQILDTTPPAAPSVSAPAVDVPEGAVLDLGDVICAQDGGTPITLRNTTTLDNAPYTGPITTSTPGTYEITYACRDANQAGDPATQTVTVNPAPGRGSDPEITGTEVIHFRQGTEPPAHGLTCADGAADLTSTITGDIAVDSTTPDGNATVTYTCTDELESKTVTHEVTYIVDGTPPVISPATGTIQLELGGTFTPETVTCTDPYPKASISNIDRAGRPAVEAALLSKAESSPQVTYDCKDAVDNHAVQSVRTFQILDTTPPAAPSVSAPAVDVPEGAVLDLGDVICAQDGGTPITLRNTTTLDNAPYTGPITTSTPGTYEITYACRDANQAGDPATQTVTVNPAPGRGSDPEITGTEVIHFRQGTEPPAHGLTCADGAADLTSTITGDIAVDSTTPDGNATVTYTCTDELESKTVTHEVTYIVDGTPPVISPATGTIQLELGGTFTPETVTCTDPYPKASISNIDRAGRPAVEAALLSKAESSPQVTYDCKDAVDNHAVQSVRTFQILDTTPPAAPSVSAPAVDVPEGAVLDLGDVICAQDGGTPITLRNTTTLDNAPYTGPITTSTPGTYEITYACRDANQAGDPATQTVTVNPAPGRGSDPEITGTEVIHFRQGTEPPAHGLTCADGAADLTSTITGDIAVDSTTPDGNATVTYTCTDELESKTVTHEVTYIVDGTPPVISPATGTIQLELGGTFTPETVTCTDPYPKASISNIDRAGRPAVEAALLSKAESSPQVTYDCKDAVDNHAVQSVRTFQILDTTPPAAPSVSAPAVDVPEGAVLDLGDVICAQDGGTPITLRNTTTLDNAPYTGPITTSTPGTYEITYACRDANQAGDPATQTVTVNPAPGRGSDPEITGTEVIHFRQGTEPPAHGLTCADGAADLTSTITGDIAVDSTTPDGNATVTYTCTDELESKTVTHEVTYIVDGTPPVISPATGTIQLELGGTFTPETVTCTDPYPKASISNIDRAGRPAVEAALLSKAESSPQVTYDCKDAVDNHAVQSVRTFQILDTTPPAAPSVSAPAVDVPEGAVLDLGDVICAQDGGTPITLRNTTTLDNAPYTGPITTSTPGTYEITYACRDANQAGDPATQTVTVNPAPGRGSDPEITGTEVIHFRQGTEPPAHGLTCADGAADLTSTITGDIAVDSTTPDGNATVTYTCTDELESKTVTHEVTYIVDGTPPVISPATGTIQLELGGTFTPETVTCTDPYPKASISNIDRAGRPAVEAALLSKAESSPQVTYDCKDAVDNHAVQSVRTFQILDTTPPAAPSVSAPAVDVPEGAVLDLGDVICAQDGGTPIVLRNTTTLDNAPYTGPITTSTPGTYEITYACRDANQAGDPATQTVTVNPAPGRGSDPEITGTEVIHFRQGTEPPAHGLTCADGAADLTSTITGDIAVDSTTPDGNATVTYTCTDELESKTVTHEVTYIVDGTPPVISPATGTIQLELGGTFTPETVTCTDPYPKASISNIDRAGRPAVEAALLSKAESSPQVTYDCKDAVDNHAVQSVRTFQILDTTPPAAPSVSAPAVDVPEGAVLDLGDVICAQDGGTPIVLRNTTTLDNAPYTGPITTSTPGTYEITYACRDANQAGDPATQTVTVNPAPGRGSDPEITGTEVIHFRQGTEPPAHGLTCADGAADLTSTITGDIAVDSTTPDGNATVTYTCTDELESKTVTHEVTYIVDGTPPVISPATGTIQLELGGTFTPETVTCTDPYPKASISNIDRAGRPAVEAALSSGAESEREITYDCTDAVGNPATQSVRTFEIRDTTAPAAPTVSLPAVTVREGAALDLGDVTCAQDDGTPITLRNSTTLDSAPHTGPIDTSVPGAYVVTYTCHDDNQAGDPATQMVTVMAAPNTPPEILLNYMNNSNVEVGTDPTATCRDAEDGDSPAARTGGAGFDVDDGTFGFDLRAKPYTFTYTCTDDGGLTNSTTGVITQVSDIPHLAITVFDYNSDGKMTSATLVDTFHRQNNDYTQEDPKCYFHTIGEVQRDTEYIPEITDEVKESISDDLGPHDVTHTCTVGGKSNTLVHTVYTISRDLPVITIRPGPEAIHALGDVFEPLSTCSPLFGDDLPLVPDIEDGDGITVDAIDESTPRGKYVITYSCTQTIEETDHHERVTLEAATARITIDVTERIKPRLVVPTDRIVHPLGEALDLASIGVTCADGEGSATLEHDPPITASTPADAIDVAVTCTDESGNYVRRTVEVVITDMDTPLLTLLGDPVITSEGHLFRDPGASCTDVQDGRPDVTTRVTRYGTDGATEIGEPGRYEIEYGCTDSDGNKAEPVTRTVHVGRVGDSLPPVISINGFSTTMMETGGAYEDLGAVCSDANYGDLPVVVREEVDAARPGSYSVTYTCTDGTFTSTAKRTVDVVAEVPEDVTPPEIRIPSGFEEFAAMDTGSTQTAGPVGALPPPVASLATGGATGIIDPAGNATFVPAPGPGGAASSHADRLPHRQGTEFVPPILWCVDGTNSQGEEIRTASNSSHMITPSTAAGQEEVTYTCKDAAGNTATRVVLRVEVEEEGRPAAASLHGSRTVSLEPGQAYREEGAMCDDGRFNRPDRQLLPVIQPGSDNPAEFSKPGRYEISYACEAAGTMSGIITRIIIVKPGGSSEEDWQLNPTFGLSWTDGSQAVRGGFSFDGTTIDVTDNFHATFARIDAAVGEEHVVTAKAYSERDLERFTIYLGVPDVSRATDSEAEIAIDVTPDSAAESWYSILGTSHQQEDPLVDVDHTGAEIRRVACSPGSDVQCLEVEVRFRVMAPLSSDIMAISAMDVQRRVTVTYVNDGVTFTGDSMIPPRTASFTFRAGNQHPAEEVSLVQKDRRYNVWEDQHGFAWLQNQYGSWIRVTHAEFERLADPTISVVTRHHDSFADLLRAEQERAALVFNATDLQREVGESFSHDAPVRVEKLKDPAILERLRVSELAALEYLGRQP